jgi:hypothetical protein
MAMAMHLSGASPSTRRMIAPWGGTGKMPVMALASGHGRYITVTSERAFVSIGELPLHVAVINL